MKIDAVIFGASGYGGGELLYWLSRHPNVASVRGTSRQFAGQSFANAHPNLRGVIDGIFESHIPWHQLTASEQPVVFSALPHGELSKRLRGLEAAWSRAGVTDRMLLIDLSSDFRVPDPEAFYETNGFPHPCPELLPRFVYGLPEWNRAAIDGASRLANPGCFATAVQLALLPLRDLKLGFIAASAATGSSGSGREPTRATHHPSRANDFSAYKVLAHQHVTEIETAMRACGISASLAFVPHRAPFVRGIFATLQCVIPVGISPSELDARAEAIFTNCPFVRLVQESPRVAAVAGSNFADVKIVARNGSVAVLVALDNLGKGMAGQAVQVMNISLRLTETAGLWQAGRWAA